MRTGAVTRCWFQLRFGDPKRVVNTSYNGLKPLLGCNPSLPLFDDHERHYGENQSGDIDAYAHAYAD